MRLFSGRIARIALIILAAGIIIGLSRSILSLRGRNGIVSERESKLKEVQAEHDLLQRKLAEAESPSFIEKEARNKLGMVRDGEVLVLLEENTGVPQSEENQADLPNWKQWVALFE
ncbi:MAG: septum formation initiator family protein [bacterium]|nr:septum formation initiator family protein [bacterium]